MVMRPLSIGPAIAALVLGMSWSPWTCAEIYKWVDQKGVTNYSGAPPASGRAQTLDPGAATVSVYESTAPHDAARLDALMRQKVARLEDQLRAERMARQRLQASHRTDAGPAYEQCLRERRVDCDRDGTRATPYFYAAAAPVFVSGRAFASAPFTLAAPFGTTAAFSQPAGASMRSNRRGASSRQGR